jgi:hypothetical protein
MRKNRIDPGKIQSLLKENKIATLKDIKAALDSSSTMTVFRKLKELGYLSSYSHRGKYYTLCELADFNGIGLWSYQSVWFSKYGNLVETTKEFILNSKAGYTANELENILNVEVKHTLLKLFNEKHIHREKVSTTYIYFALDKTEKKRQVSLRKIKEADFAVEVSTEIDRLSHELNAAIILFFSLLDEKQRRLFAGLESFKLGHGGDTKIANFLGIDVHTVAKGRRELFSGSIDAERIRSKGAGRKRVEKKFQTSSKKSKK